MAKIIGNTTSTNMPVPDWEQTNPRKADYIKNKPTNLATTEYVDKAVASVGEKPWTLLNDITLTEAVSRIDEGMYDTNYDEIWVEGLVNFETDYGTTTKTCLFFLSFTVRATSHTEYWGSVTNGRQEYFRAYLHRSPSGCAIADTVHSPNYYVSQNPKQTAGAKDLIVRKFDQCLISVGEESGKTGVRFGAGTKFKVWGR